MFEELVAPERIQLDDAVIPSEVDSLNLKKSGTKLVCSNRSDVIW